MKLTINPGDGTITVDTADNVSAAEFVRELLSGARPQQPKAIESARVAKKPVKRRRKKATPRKMAPPKADRPLSHALDETWAFLGAVAEHHPEGVTAQQVADKFHISHGGAGQRLYELVTRGMAHRISAGRYKVGPGYDESDITSLNGSPVH
jgi:hypothetical protein